jgi:hypothetical protein
VRNGRDTDIFSLDRQLDVSKTIVGSSEESLARKQAQDDEEYDLSHGSNFPKFVLIVVGSIP